MISCNFYGVFGNTFFVESEGFKSSNMFKYYQRDIEMKSIVEIFLTILATLEMCFDFWDLKI